MDLIDLFYLKIRGSSRFGRGDFGGIGIGICYTIAMFKRLYSILCLIFLFAFSQQAAIAHEISHIQDHTQKTQSHKSDLNSCSQCIGFAKLQHINDSEFVFNLEELNHYTVFVVQSHSYESLTAIHFAARAPPQTSTLN
jgi:hypothetical protein